MKEEDSQSLDDTISPQLKTLLDSLAVDVQMAKDDYLFSEGSQADKLYMIRSGRIKISKLTAGGREMTLQICDAPEMIGELGFFSATASYSTTATVLESGTFGVVNQSTLEEQLIQNGTLAVEFIKCMGRNYRRTHSKFRDLVLNGKQGAIYSTLIRLANSFGKETDNGVLIDLSLTNQELGDFCGTTRERVNRILGEMRKEKIISVKQGYITIHDLEQLREMNDCEDCPIDICRM